MMDDAELILLKRIANAVAYEWHSGGFFYPDVEPFDADAGEPAGVLRALKDAACGVHEMADEPDYGGSHLWRMCRRCGHKESRSRSNG